MKAFPRFICATREFGTYEHHIPAPYLRKTFVFDQKPQSAQIIVSGLGFYRLFVNGTEITKGFLAPYISNSDDMVYFDEYDITPLLTDGKNAIAAILGNGMQNCPGGGVWDFHLAKFRSAPKLALRLQADNTVFDTDESWKCAPSPIFFDDLRSGCFYDANREIPDWNKPGFDDSAWQNAMFAETVRGECRICEAEPIRIQQEIKPVSVSENLLRFTDCHYERRRSDSDGSVVMTGTEYRTFFGDTQGYLYDFGVNTAGVFRLKIKGQKGQRVILQAVEFLNPDGSSQSYNFDKFYPAGYGQRDIYILKREGEEEFIPSFTYNGCRYYHVSGITPEQATPDLLTYLEMHSDLKETGGFSCSDDLINRLQEICMRSAKSNFYYFPTDCPHREKNGWTGDASYSAEYMLMNFAAEKSFAEWERNICKAMRDDGALPGIVPTGGWGFHWGNGPAWDRIVVYLPYYTYLYTGNRQIVSESAHAIQRYLDYLTKKTNENGLFAFGLGDWCPPARDAGNYAVPLELTDSIMVMSICEKAAYLFGELQLPLQKAFAEALYAQTKANIRKSCIDFVSMTAEGACQSAQAMYIFYDVFEPGEKPAAFKRLLDFIAEKDGHCDCGYLGNRVIFHVLAQGGETELALNMITRPDFPSYAYPVLKFGSTSLWENYCLEENASLNHHFFGDISNFFIKHIAGLQINPLRRNPNEFAVKPFFAKNFDHAEAYYTLPAGRVEVKWKKDGDDVILSITMPENAVGKVVLPQGYAFATNERSPDGTGSGIMNAKSGTFTAKRIGWSI